MACVLLVEDEPNIASIIVFKLKREGHEVRWESSALAVPAAAEAIQPDLILLDSSLPDGDAFALLTTLVAKHPVVMIKPTQLARLVAELVPATAGHP